MKNIILIALVLAVSAGAESIYIAQTAAGSDDGSSCGNAHAASWFNTSGNWGAGAGKISAGDTAHLCGAITSGLTMQGSGTAGNRITILFETNAKMSAAHWNGVGANDAAFDLAGKDYVTIDGGTNGIIECTNNGTNLTYHLACNGIYASGSDSLTIRNMHIINIYNRVKGGDTYYICAAVELIHCSNLIINNCTMYQAGRLIDYGYTADSNVTIYNDSLSKTGEGGVVIGSANSVSTCSNVNIYGCWFSKDAGQWSGYDAIHTNCIHIFAKGNSASKVSDINVYGNYFTGDWGDNSTSYLYLEGNPGVVKNSLIYNNLFVGGTASEGGGNGYIFGLVIDKMRIYNNTIVTPGEDMSGIMTSGDSVYIKNNLLYNSRDPVASPYDTPIISCDSNVYYYTGTQIFNWGDYSQKNFAQWKAATGFDSHTSINQPALVSYVPLGSDTVAHRTGFNLSSVFTTDYRGKPRSATEAWDKGAFESDTISTHLWRIVCTLRSN